MLPVIALKTDEEGFRKGVIHIVPKVEQFSVAESRNK